MLSSHLKPNITNDIFPSGFVTANFYAFIFSPMSTCTATFVLFDFIGLTLYGKGNKLRSSLLHTFLQFPITFPLLRAQFISLRTLFSDTHNPCPSFDGEGITRKKTTENREQPKGTHISQLSISSQIILELFKKYLPLNYSILK
jgi:hypothetical protein